MAGAAIHRVSATLVAMALAAAAFPAVAHAEPSNPKPAVELVSPEELACTGDPGVAHPIEIAAGGERSKGLYALPASQPKGLVAFFHGYGHTSESWREHIKATAARNDVIAFVMDYRGIRPRIPGVQGPGWPVATGSEDMIGVAQHFLRACKAIPTVVAFGVSMGGNVSGYAAAAGAKRLDGRPLFDFWFELEGVTDLAELYTAARVLAPANATAKEAQGDIEREMGGKTLEQAPEEYRKRTIVTRAEDIEAAGIKGVVIVHGVNDGLVPYNQSQEMAARLAQVGIPTDLFTVGRRAPGTAAGTTLDSYAFGSTQLPFAGHASERDAATTLMKTGFDRLAAFFQGAVPPCPLREFVVDGEAGTTTPDPSAAGC